MVQIVNLRSSEVRKGRSGNIITLKLWVGYYEGTEQRCSWGDDGRYSPVAKEHPLDIVGRPRR